MSDESDLSELIVTDRAALAEACGALAAPGKFGFDTEFIRERSYVPQVCLIQAATAERAVLIDPLAVDPGEFWELVTDASVEKIVHAGEQDLEMCYRHTGRPPKNVFDVQVAAALAGVGHSLSYGNLVAEALGIETVQGNAYSEWTQRPLDPEQLHYAVEDVAHLAALETHLRARLAELGREDWMREEMLPLECEDLYDAQPIHVARRNRNWTRLGRRRLGILCELIAWREEAARADDVPPRTMLRDSVLQAVGRDMPTTIGELAAVKGFPRPLARRRGQGVLDTLRRGANLPEDQIPEASARETDRALVTWAMDAGRGLCEDAGIDHAVFASRRNYIDLVEAIRARQKDLSGLRMMTGWRRDFAGEQLRKLIARRLKE